MNGKAIVLANGKAPRKSFFRFARKNGFEKIICADGGANSIKKLGLIPQVILGDLDSASEEVLKEFSTTSEIIRIADQNTTDMEKALMYCVENGIAEVLLAGVTGTRLDHSLGNLSLLHRFIGALSISLMSEDSLLTPVNDSRIFMCNPNDIFSIYGFGTDVRITTRGLKYELDDSPLKFGVFDSTSNVAVGFEVYVKVTSGYCFVIRSFKEVASHGNL